jgi:hypothetical protein
MSRIHTVFLLTAVLWQGSVAAIAAAPPLAEPDSRLGETRPRDEACEQFVRLRRGADQQPLALETAILRFVPADAPDDGVSLDLIGVIHVGDKSYYDELNRRFRDFDAVLYELVAPADANVPRAGERPGSAIGGLQVGMTAMLELDYQLDHIDYAAPNMVHADMTPDEFARTMKARNESFTGMFFRMMGRAFGEQARNPFRADDLRLLAAMVAEDRAHQMKLILAEEFSDLRGQIDLFDGPDGSTIVTERNKKALEVLRHELAAGKKRLALFYGAGHLADFQRRLQEDFGMKRVATEWVEAWSLTPAEN